MITLSKYEEVGVLKGEEKILIMRCICSKSYTSWIDGSQTSFTLALYCEMGSTC